MLATTQDIKNIGLDSIVWNISDDKKEGEKLSPLDKFLSRFLVSASARLQSWVGQETYAQAVQEKDEEVWQSLRQAELYIALVNLLPILWAQSGVGEGSLSFDGVNISMARTSKEEQAFVLSQLVFMAESFALPWIVPANFGGVLS